MAQPENSHQPTNVPSARSLQASVRRAEIFYQQAVKALKQQDFERAIAQFRPLSQSTAVPPAYRLKARMGLIRAYQQSGQVEQAYALCQPLLTSPTTQVRQWASQTLESLAHEGITPAFPIEPTNLGLEHSSTIAPTSEGRPLEQSANSIDRSGFVPLSETTTEAAASAAPASRHITNPQTARLPSPEMTQNNSGSVNLANPPDSQPDSAASLFHYQQLNAQASFDQPPLGIENEAASPASPKPVTAEAIPSVNRLNTPQPDSAALPRRSVVQAQPLPKPLFQLWGAQLITAVITLWAINAAIHLSLRSVNRLLWGLPWPLQLSGIPSFEQDYSVWIIAGLTGLALASPWLMDQILSWGYGQRSLSTRQLQAQHPNVLRLLRQVCRQHGWQLPELRLIPDSVPLCFSYGWLPRNTRIVVSQGLLDTCSEENLTALYNYELGHIANGDLPVISAIGMWLLLLYTGYWRLALWGNSLDAKPARITVGLVANGLYGLFWLLRKLVLWLSRLRCAWGDRRAAALTQQPGQLQHSLLTLTANLADHVHKQQPLHPLPVCLDILMPLSTQAAISPGSFFPSVDALTVMAKDCLNPYRRWLLTNASHPPLAERLQQLDQQAFKHGQPTYLSPLSAEEPAPSFELSPLLLQKAPVVGLLAGGGLALGLWLVGGIVNRFNWQRLSWFYQDSSLLQGGLLLGLGLGLLVRINALYPDINPRLAPATEPGESLLNGRKILPVQGQPIWLEGKLVGAPGIANWFGQALYLETSEGIVSLKAPSPLLGWRGVIQSPRHVVQWLGRRVNVLGWQRQGGGLMWLDIAKICSSSQRDCFIDQGPLWATLVSLGLCLAGIWVILTGG